ncbi:DinB family protein [Hymenobacter aquaticus]|uniref:DinB family protein n=1 Tax=Hymenobacter aquaticus TaxID=1867101 RepID=A0A4Z0Q1Q3_9BACT|nr:DinB family protein [Hymenobacter aquaticus]TGE23910.1 DinB family protein [Hymenobacter aquaticus]
MESSTRATIVAELKSLLEKGFAHASLEEACADIPAADLNRRVPQVPYTLWELVEHIRIAQWDILEFCRDATHGSPEWPAGYWPAAANEADEATFQATLRSIRHDRNQFLALLQDPARDLLAPLPHGTGQNLLREAMLIADHTSYHMGQLVLLRRLLGNWS